MWGLSETGGSAQESNLPRTLDAPHTGFEVRGTHQDPTASTGVYNTFMLREQTLCAQQARLCVCRGLLPAGEDTDSILTGMLI